MSIFTAKDVEVIKKELSPSLRLTKYANLKEDKSKSKDIIDYITDSSGYSKFAIPEVNNLFYYDHFSSKKLSMKLGGRLIINQAGGVLENANLCIHRHFGYPYIPGSAVKGIARHSAWHRWCELIDVEKENKQTNSEQTLREVALKTALTFGFPTNDKMPNKAKDIKRESKSDYLDDYLADTYPDLFGKDGTYSSFSGAVSFLAAVPSEYNLVTDVLTCHHNKYYSGEQPKAYDNENPVPVFFPAVEEGAIFKFSVIPLNKCKLIKNKYSFDPVDFAMDCLKEGLEIHGIGAKTSAGYGWFEEDPAEATKRKREGEEKARLNKILQEEKQKLEEIALKEQKRINEIKRIDDESKYIRDSLVEKGFSEINEEVDLGKILSLAKRLNETESQLSEKDKSNLMMLLKQSYNATGKKDKRWKHPKKSKDTWKQIRVLLSEEMAKKLMEELS